jgi:hypothetical protein
MEVRRTMKRIQQKKGLLRILILLREGVSAVHQAESMRADASDAVEQLRLDVARLRLQLYEHVVQGPMTAIEAHEFLSSRLNGAHLDLLLAVVATLDQARRDGHRPG